jgi:SagB-type dehydrogenase family enzyme|uniref:SagB/ThcOx family dehydrogenase n=1 Tax=candidate division WOR-3 bacterium TaxID=2052148 RepID=A0A7V3PS59_UNCW3
MFWLVLLFIAGDQMNDNNTVLILPEPDTIGKITVEQALLHRRSVRSFSAEPLTLEDISQLLWAAQGKTGKTYGRTAPSAGATYPMEVFLVAGNVSGIDAGIYQYLIEIHGLKLIRHGNFSKELANAALGQNFISTAPAVIVLTCEYRRTTGRYGERGIRYVHMEAGHIGENISLECVARQLGTVMVGAFLDSAIQRILSTKYEPLYIIPVGHIKK